MSYLSDTLLERKSLSEFLVATADELDIPEQLYEEATVKYEQVGTWLSEDKAEIGNYSPQIYPQGSFRLGTAVRPINPECDYDIDLVCFLDIPKALTTQRDLKALVGQRLRQNAEFAKILSPSRRCWNLSFPRQFHMDVLPAIPNAEQPPDGILLTDTELRQWQKSNPKEYAEWFYHVMARQLEKRRAELAKALGVSIEDVPYWRVKTPLQRAIQLLKRHRDVLFQHNVDDRPTSIIITTLAARAYRGQDDVYDALLDIAANMPTFIENRAGSWWVENPVERDENFADKWNESPHRRIAFLEWLVQIQADVRTAAHGRTLQEASTMLKSHFGAAAVENAERRFSKNSVASALGIQAVVRPLPTVNYEVPHCCTPEWPIVSRYKVDLRSSVHFGRHGKRVSELARRRVGKKLWLKFVAETNTPAPYVVRWQVVNTGSEAAAAQQLRGDFYESNGSSNGVRWESTAYSGVHWVEAFIIKNELCVARSGRKYVCVA